MNIALYGYYILRDWFDTMFTLILIQKHQSFLVLPICRNESEFIVDIVKDILEMSSKIPAKSEIFKDLVGMDSCWNTYTQVFYG